MAGSSGGPAGRAVVVVAGLALVAGGGWAWFAQAPPEGAPSASAAGGASGSGGTGAAAVAEPAAAPVVRRPAGAPRVLVVPALDARAPVLAVGDVDGTLVPPSDPEQMGWWAKGARPGAARGSALVTGHTVQGGAAPLNELDTLERGDAVRVRTAAGTVRYRVRSVAVYAKGEISADAERLFSQEVPGRLVLITCADWDGTQYLSNTVVTARPLA